MPSGALLEDAATAVHSAAADELSALSSPVRGGAGLHVCCRAGPLVHPCQHGDVAQRNGHENPIAR
jgi:hypothetical protein